MSTYQIIKTVYFLSSCNSAVFFLNTFSIFNRFKMFIGLTQVRRKFYQNCIKFEKVYVLYLKNINVSLFAWLCETKNCQDKTVIYIFIQCNVTCFERNIDNNKNARNDLEIDILNSIYNSMHVIDDITLSKGHMVCSFSMVWNVLR